ncbi:hypothetical protein V6N11_049269 [Hibiscus sabdariffa]|uniref:Retrovirus-related Pol polyprotein from transposon TNT 1-94-like beta-barrel domain-containing protein n=1 Tax=Hibiscus sabdariffa TaxID=183260 RepID=A0ABR2NZZ8_9ROSI
MGNDGLVSVTGMGDVSLVSNNGTKIILKDVRHTPNIRLNLISAGKLDNEDFCNTFSDGQWKLTKDSLVMARGKKSSNLYLIHISEKGLDCLAKKNQISGLKNATLKNCAHCLAGNQRRVSFRSRPPHRKSELLELIIDDIDKTDKEDSPNNGDLTDVNPVPLDPSLNPIQDDVHCDVNDDQQDIGDFNSPINDIVTDQQQAPIAPPTVPLRRSSRDRRSSVRYSSNDYVLLIDEGEPECYKEAMECECKDQ